MSDQLRILIQGNLDIKSTASEINRQLKQIKLNKLDLTVNVNTSNLSKASESLKKTAQSYEQWWSQVLQKQEKERERVLQVEHKTRVALDKRQEQDREKALQQEQRIRKSIEEQRVKEEQRVASEREKALQAEQRIRNKIDQDTAKRLINQQKNDFNVDNYKQQTQAKVQNLLTAYGSNVDKKQLQEFQYEVNKLTTSTPKLNQEIQKLNTSFKQIEANARTSANSLGGTFDNALSKIIQWGAATTVIYGTVNAMQSLIQTSIELDDQMTQLKRVMNEGTNFAGLFEGSIELSRELGQTLSNTNASLIEFARAGQSSAEALANTRAVLLAMNVSELSAAEATKAVIVGRQVFNDELENSVDLISRLNQVDNDFSTSTKDLALSLIKAGSTAKTFGADLNTLIGYTVAIQASTQESGNVVGNSLKTILSRLTTVTGSVDALNSVGISIRDMAGNMKPVSEVITELSSKWSTLSAEQQQNIALQAAGRYQLNRFLALMQGVSVAQKASASAANSQGSALRENEKAMQSLNHQLNALQGAWQELVYVISDGGLNTGLSVTIKAITGLIHGFTEFTKMTGGLNIALPALALSLYGISKAFTAISIAAKSAELGVKGFKLSSGLIGVAILGIEALVSAFLASSDAVSQSTEDIQKFAEKTRDTSNNLTNLIDRYDELKSSASVNAESQKELQQVMNDIQRIQPALVESTDKYGNAMEINTGKAKAYAETLRAMSVEQATLAKATLQAQNAKLDLDIEDSSKERDKIQDSYQETYEQIISFQNKYKVKAIEDAREIIDVRQKELDAIKESGNSDLYAQKRVELLDYVKELKRYEENLDSIGDTEFLDAQKSLQALEDKKKGNLDLITSLDQIITGVKQTKKSQDELNSSFKQGIMDSDEFGESASEIVDAQEEFIKSIDKSKKEVASLNQVLADLAEGKSITADEAADLILKEQELADAFTLENGMMKVNQEAIVALRDAKVKSFNDIATARQQDLANQQTTLVALLNNYGVRIKAIESVADAEEALAGIGSRMNQSKSIAEAMELEKTQRQVEGVKTQFEQLENLKKLVSSPSFGTKSSSGSKGSKSEYAALSEDAKRLLEIETQLAEVQTKRQQLHSSSQAYRDSLQEEKKLLQDKIGLLQKEYDQVTKTQRIGGKSNKIGGSSKDSDESLKRASELEQQIVKLKGELSSLSFQQVTSELDEYAAKTEELNYHLDLSRTRMNLFREDSQDYVDELRFQIDTSELIQDSIQNEIGLIKERLQQGNLTIAQQGELRQKLADLTKEQLNYQVSIEQTRRSLQGMIKDSLEVQKNAYLETLQKRQENAVERLEKKLDKVNDQYDREIEKQREKLDLLDEEYEKEDRLKKLQEIDDEINKIKGVNDHDFVMEDGTLINTYDKERVSELEKERNELLQQYQREDIKEAINDEIERLEEAKNHKAELLQEEIDNLKEKNAQELEVVQKRWEDLIKAAEEGTLSFDNLMHGDKGWYAKALNYLEKYGDGVQSQIDRIKSLYQALGNITVPNSTTTTTKTNSPSVSSGGSGGSSRSSSASTRQSDSDKTRYGNNGIGAEEEKRENEERIRVDNAYRDSEIERTKDVINARETDGLDTKLQKDYLDKLEKLKKYHDGGIVGDKAPNKLVGLANKMFNNKPDEALIKSLLGELQIPPKNIMNNFIPAMQMYASAVESAQSSQASLTENHYHFDNMTVKSDNPVDWMQGLETLIKSRKY